MVELKHLRTIASLNATNSIRKSAEALHTSQSALSHQIKELEHKLDAELFKRNTDPIIFSQTGLILLTLANKVLPEIDHTLLSLTKPNQDTVSITLAIECHACFQWLFDVTKKLSSQRPKLSFDVIDNYFDDADTRQPDIIFTDESKHSPDYNYQEIGHFELVLVMPSDHPLADKPLIIAEDFADITLLTYPIAQQKMDIFNLVLQPSGMLPKQIKQVTNSFVILQMIASNYGLAVLPDWLVNSLAAQTNLVSRPVTANGLQKTLFIKYKDSAKISAVCVELLPEVRRAFAELTKCPKQKTL